MQRFESSWRRLWARWKRFDDRFYRERYPDVTAARMNPFLHYLLHGAAEGRKPNRWFDPDYYLARSAAAKTRGGDPFVDFLLHGSAEHAATHPLFIGPPSHREEAPAQAPAEGSLFGCDS